MQDSVQRFSIVPQSRLLRKGGGGYMHFGPRALHVFEEQRTASSCDGQVPGQAPCAGPQAPPAGNGITRPLHQCIVEAKRVNQNLRRRADRAVDAPAQWRSATWPCTRGLLRDIGGGGRGHPGLPAILADPPTHHIRKMFLRKNVNSLNSVKKAGKWRRDLRYTDFPSRRWHMRHKRGRPTHGASTQL